ncbi:MAG: hypothetical protein RIF34_10185, partial [Candidatus Kapaibacterium sp.]
MCDEGGLAETSSKDATSAIFTQEPVFTELVRASEGVPRDFINILQLASMRAGNERISMNHLRGAARDWFERDKERNIDTNPRAQNLLNWIRDRVIMGRKCRAFLMETSKKDSAIEFLFDERLLHIAKRSYSAKDDPGVRYRVWKVDCGCYIDLVNTANA